MDNTFNNRKSVILIDGAFGQDGQIIVTELCKSKKVDVHVITHHQISPKLPNAWDSSQVKIIYWDSRSFTDLCAIVQDVAPSAYINLAAHHHSALDMAKDLDQAPLYGHNYCRSALVIVALCCYAPSCHFHYASSSLIHTASFGSKRIYPDTMPSPASPYGLAKARIMYLIDTYRKNRGLVAAVSILFNHDSPLKKSDFLLPRIAQFVAEVVNNGKTSCGKLRIHNIAAAYDLSSALIVARQVLHITESRLEGNYVLASGRVTSVKDILNFAFSYVSLNWENFVEYEKDEKAPFLIGCPSLTLFRTESSDGQGEQRDLVEEMVASQLRVSKGSLL
jgi:GDPmannose 4,6-dehydratase